MGSAISEATTSGRWHSGESALAGVFGQGASLFGNLFSSLFGGGAAGGTGGGGGWLQLGMSAASAYFGGGFADGGRIRGPGTGTSDSIPILASNDEFMTPCRRGTAARRTRVSGAVQPVWHGCPGRLGEPSPPRYGRP
ncbi:hypothetical protein QT611_12380 [Pseudomonas aeruginosa]|nr:hypothetical protein [Pseudomonas aeruginosa]